MKRTVDNVLEFADRPHERNTGRVLIELAVATLREHPPRGGGELLEEFIAAAEAGDTARAKRAADRLTAVAIEGPERAGKPSSAASRAMGSAIGEGLC